MKSYFYELSGYLKRHKPFVEAFLIIFYLVGFLGIVIPLTNPLFMKLFPVALILNIIVLLFFHEGLFNTPTILSLLIIGLSGYLIEVTGVHMSVIFGNYSYGNSLGIKVFNTPLLIGANWLMLTYAFSAITEEIRIPIFAKSLLASFLMVVYDIVLEYIAPLTDMWVFENGTAPFRNYIAWFIVALIFQLVLRMRLVRVKNSIALVIILIQLSFFAAQIIFFKLFA
jgi:bisanhydrobacterioruberin hydratase